SIRSMEWMSKQELPKPLQILPGLTLDTEINEDVCHGIRISRILARDIILAVVVLKDFAGRPAVFIHFWCTADRIVDRRGAPPFAYRSGRVSRNQIERGTIDFAQKPNFRRVLELIQNIRSSWRWNGRLFGEGCALLTHRNDRGAREGCAVLE